MAALEGVPGLVMAGFSRLGPRTVVNLHFDADDPPIYRCHLGIEVPLNGTLEMDGAVRHHARGRWLCFHGAAEHLARNDSDEERVTLLVDVLRSAHPEAEVDRPGSVD